MHTNQRLNLSKPWEGLQTTGRGFKPDSGNSSRQDALHRFPQLPIRWERPSGIGWILVHLSRFLPRMGKVAKGKERCVASNGQAALRPRAGSGDGVVPEKPASIDPRAAYPTDRENAGPLCLLRHIGQLSSTKLVRPEGYADLAKMAVAAGESAPVGAVPRSPKATSSAGSSDRPSVHCCERSSPVRNRMLEIGTSGSVRGRGGNIPTYSAVGQGERAGPQLREKR